MAETSSAVSESPGQTGALFSVENNSPSSAPGGRVNFTLENNNNNSPSSPPGGRVNFAVENNSPVATGPPPNFEVGDTVDVFSGDLEGITGKVVTINPDGTFLLEPSAKNAEALGFSDVLLVSSSNAKKAEEFVPTTPQFGPTTPQFAPTTPPAPTQSPLTPTMGKAGNDNEYLLLARKVLKNYFDTFEYPFVRHQIDSYDQFLIQDLPAVIKSNNPLLLLRELDPASKQHIYRVEVFVGGEDGTALEIGTPTISLQKAEEVRVLFPNEARLRNLTYASTVYADIFVRVIITPPGQAALAPLTREFKRMPLFKLPIMLHSRFCLLHNKPKSFLKEAGECVEDQGGYFVVDGAEKVLVTRQEQAFNTFYVKTRPNDPKVATYGTITCLSPTTRQLRVVSFNWVRATDTLVVTLPYVRKAVPIFVLFRAFGFQTDGEILQLLFPDLESTEAKQMIPHLLPSIAEAFPFLDTYSAVQFMKPMTKGYTESHVYDILYNQTFIHIPDKFGGSRAHFLADCVRKFLRVHLGIDPNIDRDDTQNQRCLPAGTLIRMLFNNVYTTWLKAVKISIDKQYNYFPDTYRGTKFINMFNQGNIQDIFHLEMMTEGIMRGYKGSWITGGAKRDLQSGVLQSLSRMSYMDFMSQLRRVNLNFDTSMKLTGPRQLHTSQFGFFCTNETPSGSSIGITKNLSLMTLISTATEPEPVIRWMMMRSWVIPCNEMRPDLQRLGIPVFVNNGIIGYTLEPFQLIKVLKLLKWTGCLPAMASIGFNIKHRRVFLFIDEGRPCRPLIHLGAKGQFPKMALESLKEWRDLVFGTLAETRTRGISTTGFLDILADRPGPLPFSEYINRLEPHVGVLEYIDPYEQNLMSLVSFPEQITIESTHCEIHPSTIVSIINGLVPFANFNQSPRNQLSCSQSKQAVSLYATNFMNRYDNNVNIACYNEAPLVRTYQYDLLGEGKMPYGQNLIMAIMCYQGYNQDDGIVFNYDSFMRGMFRNINLRSYTTYEEFDKKSNTTTNIANPLRVPQWTEIRPGCDYTKLDERGIIRAGSLVDETTVLVGKYIQDATGKINDSSLTAQVWTTGRVESVVVTINNVGQQMVKVRVTQDRIPELGDKFSTRHGQKGVMGMLVRAHDLPRTADGLVPDMIVNPHCIPSRMTIAQLLEMLFGEICYQNTMIGDASLFMNDSRAPEILGKILQDQFAMEKHGNRILYDGTSGSQIETNIFMGPIYAMRLKHMVEDKWNSRAEGRKEQRTHQPTGGRGAQGGLRIGEMERDAIIAHGASRFMRESLMERADKAVIRICNGCGTVPIYNDKQKLFVCSLCDGPVKFVGSTPKNLEILPPMGKSLATSSLVEMPYATKLLSDELGVYLNIGMRFLTAKGLTKLREPSIGFEDIDDVEIRNALLRALPPVEFPEARVPEFREAPSASGVEVNEEDLLALGLLKPKEQEEEEEQGGPGVTIDVGGSGDTFGQPSSPPYAPSSPAYAPIGTTPPYNPGGTTPPYYGPGGITPPYNPGGTTPPYGPGGTTPPYYGPGGTTPPYAPGGTTPPYYGPGGTTPLYAPSTPVYAATAMGQQMGGAMVPQASPLPPPQPPMILNTMASGSPPIIVIPSGPQTMEGGGFGEEYREAAQGRPVMGQHRRHTTPRARAMSPRKENTTFGGGPVAATTRITIRKLN